MTNTELLGLVGFVLMGYIYMRYVFNVTPRQVLGVGLGISAVMLLGGILLLGVSIPILIVVFLFGRVI